MKVYTKTGDDGSTALFGGQRIKKSEDRVSAYGDIDELNSFLGLLISRIQDVDMRGYLENIQHILFNIGSLIATVDKKFIEKLSPIHRQDIESLENKIDEYELSLSPLSNFILPGGGEDVCLAHVCRTVCRRAERSVIRITNREDVTEEIKIAIAFLNRLSDYFFVLSRKLTQLNSGKDVIWKKEVKL